MKKTARKLRLTKETMLHLESKALGRFAGAQTIGTNCPSWLCPTSDGPFECAFACIGP